MKKSNVLEQDRQYIRIQHKETKACAAKITLISCSKSSNGTDEFVFCKDFVYKRSFKKTIKFFTKLDLRANGIINFWIETSKLNDDVWDIYDDENELKFGALSLPGGSVIKKLQHSKIENKKHYSSKPTESKLVTNENQKLQPNYSSKPVENNNDDLQKIIQNLQKENQLLLDNREQEIKNLNLENELKIEKIKLDHQIQENARLVQELNNPNKQNNATHKQKSALEAAGYFRASTYIKEGQFKICEPIIKGDEKINIYKFETGAQGSKYGAKSIICTTKKTIEIGNQIWWHTHESKSFDSTWEINDEENHIFLSSKKLIKSN